MKGQRIIKMCHVDQNCCPEIRLDSEQGPDKEVVFHDDFGSRIRMSREQFGILVRQAKDGKFEGI